MKTLMPFFFLIFPVSLFCQGEFTLFYGMSYPLGIDTGFKIETDQFTSSLMVNYLDGLFQVEKGYFKSEIISLGSISFNGFLKKHQKETPAFYSPEEKQEAHIFTGDNPPMRKGIIFTGPERFWGLTGFRDEDISEILLWFYYSPDQSSFLSLSQSCSFPESPELSDSWYLDEYIMNSEFNLNSGLSYEKKDDSYFWGSSLFLSASLEDPTGLSLDLFSGFSISGLFIQNEITLNSKYYKTAELDQNKYPFVYKGKISSKGIFLSFDSSIIFLLEKEPFLWESRLWSLKSESTLKFENPFWKLNGKLTMSIYNETDNSHYFSYKLDCSVRRSFSSIFLEAGGTGCYDKIFGYMIDIKSGYESRFFDLSLIGELEIVKKIDFSGFLKGKIKTEHFNFLFSFSTRNIPIYNCDPDDRDITFFAGIELFQELGRRE